MTNKFLDQTALITGTARRIGAEMALFLAAQGYDIALHYNNSKKEATELQKKITDLGVKCNLFEADLSDVEQLNKMIQELLKACPNWNVLINNASIFKKTTLLKDNFNEFFANFSIHLQAPLLLSKALAENCRKQQIQGNIINMLDKNIARSNTQYFYYLLSKKSLAIFTKMAAMELAPQIRVNGIAPGFILNSIDSVDYESETKLLTNNMPLKKQGNTKNITSALHYLLNNDFVTGEILFVDGGSNLNHSG